MAYDFQKLADVELLEEVPDGASAFVVVDGTVKRVPGSGLGGGSGVATAILRFASESDNSKNAVTWDLPTKPNDKIEFTRGSLPVEKLPITCDNYTYTQARAILEAGDPFAAMSYVVDGNVKGWLSSLSVALFGNFILMVFAAQKQLRVYWNSDGFFNGNPEDDKS